MNPSRIFILRPVGTSLLMVAILLVGIVAYGFLPLSALPEVDYPTIQVQTFYPGASPEVMTSSVTAPLERQFGQMPGPQPDVVGQFGRRVGDHAAVQPRPQPRHRRAGGAGGDQCGGQPAAVRSAGAADLRQGQSGRRADPDAGADLEDAAADRRSRISPTRGWRRRSRSSPASAWSASAAAQRPAVRIQVNPRALAAYGLNIDDLRTTLGNANVNTPKGSFDGPRQATTINANDQITSADGLRDTGDRLPQRRAGAADRCRDRGAGRGEHQARRLGQHARRRSS